MRNKIKVISVLSALSLLLSFAPVFAEDSVNDQDSIQEHRQERINHEKERVQALHKLADNQISRAQKELDRLAVIIDRIKTQRAKLGTASTDAAASSTSSTDLAKIDDMIAKAEALKQKVETDIADAKAKETALVGTIKTVEDKINTETSTSTPVVNTAAPTPVVQSVRSFQASMKVLKKDMIALHKSLQSIVQAMRKLTKSSGVDKAKKPESEESAND